MSFEQRLAPAIVFERAVRQSLNGRGWIAEPFGQSQLTTEMRDMLRAVRPTTPVRWMPDIVAGRRFAARTLVVYIDAKAGERWRDTGKHSFETAAVESAAKWADYSLCPTYFVCSDWSVFTPEIVAQEGSPGPYIGNGSGTPFLLVPRILGHDFDCVFPAGAWT